jgi:hypothetical protein
MKKGHHYQTMSKAGTTVELQLVTCDGQNLSLVMDKK